MNTVAISNRLSERVAHALDLLTSTAARHNAIVFTTSFGAEDMVITDLIAKRFRQIDIATIDTGRLPAETYSFMAQVETHYSRRIRVLFPETQAVENYVRVNGINAFYDSRAQREDCCHVRKVEPLQRLLAGKAAWITGLRREQSAARANISERGYDSTYQLEKINPLADWTEADVWAYLNAHDVPRHPLHDQGYPSIGCAPCTRAIRPGEHVRAGRWWWEADSAQECGLHVAFNDTIGAVA